MKDERLKRVLVFGPRLPPDSEGKHGKTDKRDCNENFNFAILHFARESERVTAKRTENFKSGFRILRGLGGDPREVWGCNYQVCRSISLKDGGLNGGDPIGG